MTAPHIKAGELITKYFISNPGYGPMERDRARRNAIMSVNELVDESRSEGNTARFKYWREVKKNLEQNENK